MATRWNSDRMEHWAANICEPFMVFGVLGAMLLVLELQLLNEFSVLDLDLKGDPIKKRIHIPVTDAHQDVHTP
jgi:hypothetical protein